MNKKIITIMIIHFVLIVSCEHASLAIQNGLKNIITAPLSWLKKGANAITGNTYNNLKRKTQASRKNQHEDVCLEIPEVLQESDKENIQSIAQKSRDTVCSCRTWGNCPKEICSCDKMCPWSLELLKRRPLKEHSKPENSLAFRNRASIFRDKFSDYRGFCYGHAKLTQKFNRLGFFRPDQKPPYNLNSSNSEEQRQAINFYRNIVKKIRRNEVVEIPGFKNLQQFSEDPAIQTEILANEIGKEWADYATHGETLLGVAQGAVRGMSRSQAESQISKIKEMLDDGLQPSIVFTCKGCFKSATPHAVLVSHYEITKDGQTVLCIRDNKVSPQKNYQCDNRMYLGADGKLKSNNHLVAM